MSITRVIKTTKITDLGTFSVPGVRRAVGVDTLADKAFCTRCVPAELQTQ